MPLQPEADAGATGKELRLKKACIIELLGIS
jgi:hypothetical protein